MTDKQLTKRLAKTIAANLGYRLMFAVAMPSALKQDAGDLSTILAAEIVAKMRKEGRLK